MNAKRMSCIVMFILAVCLLFTACAATNGGQNERGSSSASNAQTTTTQPTSAGAESSSESAVYPLTVEHALGKITLAHQPERIYAPYMEDALLTLGIKPVLKWSYGPLVQQYLEPQLQDVPKIDFSGGNNYEQVLAAQPDLIVLYSSEMAANGVYEQFSNIAPTYVFPDAAGDWQQTVRVLGKLTGKEAEATQAIDNYNRLVKQAHAQLEPITNGKTFAIIRIKPKQLNLMEGIYFSGVTLYHDLGLTPPPLVKEKSWNKFAVLSMEGLSELNADYIFYTVQGSDAVSNEQTIQSSAIWKQLPAVRAGHAYKVENNYWLASGAIANTLQIKDVVRLVTAK
ncbi:ABC transporter substrate-binding protein [Paenibacillus sp. SGZ-1009]|uniref:ABC transporter substrate-binding protein n=1 Tax=Paenibacillus campi TaxID=3106031 RepID=UPI002AFFB8AA|nr:ABC transporter substrate-binding protein [Paenibacillus sp. SGZ-1009]